MDYLFYQNKRFVDLIQVIEANFVYNLSVEMTIAYYDGIYIEDISRALKEHNDILTQFTFLFDNIDEYSELIVKDIYHNHLLRFKILRGRWFINSGRVEHGGKS